MLSARALACKQRDMKKLGRSTRSDLQAKEEATWHMPIPDMISEILHGGFAARPNALEKLQQIIGEPINYG